MFGQRKRASVKASAREAASVPVKTSSIDLSDDLLHLEQTAETKLRLSEIDFFDLEAPRLKQAGVWRPLKLYETDVIINLTNFALRGQWAPGFKGQVGELGWYEQLFATAKLLTSDGAPLLTFDKRDQEAGAFSKGATYLVAAAEFPKTLISVDSEIAANAALAQEIRSEGSHFRGHPVKLFRNPKEASEWIDSEIIPHQADTSLEGTDSTSMYRRPQIYSHPQIVFCHMEYKDFLEHQHAGFYGSDIQVPEDVFNALRRGAAEFRDRARVAVRARMQLYGVGIYPATEYSPEQAEFSIVPKFAQLAGRILKITLDWDGDGGPIGASHVPRAKSAK